MASMAGAEVPKTQIPRWIQLVGLPVLLLIGWTVAGAIRHVVFVFLVAALLALLLNPIVRAVGRRWIARGFAVAIVYVSFAALIILLIAAIATAVVSQTRSAANRVDDYFTIETGQPPRTAAERDVDRFQLWLNHHHLKQVKVRKQLNDAVDNVKAKDVEKYTTRVIDFVEGAAIGTVKLLFSLVLVIVISIYMLLYMERLGGAIDRRFPPAPGSPPLLQRVEHALASYVKGQVLLSLIIGTSAGLGLWLLGTTGLLPGGDRYALLFGAFVAFMELIPYIGPWLGAVPPFVYALIVHPLSAVWVALLFLGDPPARGARRGAERDGLGAPAQPAARDLRAARRRRDLRAARARSWRCRCSPRGARPGSSSTAGSCSSRSAGRRSSRSRSPRRRWSRPRRVTRPRRRPTRRREPTPAATETLPAAAPQ